MRAFSSHLLTFHSTLQFREAVAQKFNVQPIQLCLVFVGKILRDHETLMSNDIKHGQTVHIVIRAPPPPEVQPQVGPGSNGALFTPFQKYLE